MCLITRQVILLSQVFGYLPVKYKSSQEINNLVFSPKVFLWSLSVISLQTGFIGFTLYAEYKEPDSEVSAKIKINPSSLTVFLDIAPLLTLAIAIFLSSIKRFPHFIKMCQLIERADRNLDIKKNSNKWKIKLTLIILFTIVIYGLTIKLFSNYGKFVEVITFRSIHLAEAAFLIHFSQAIQSIADLFQKFNQKLKRDIIGLSYGQLMTNHCVPDIEYTRSETSASKFNLNRLTRIYWLLHQTKTQANLFYGSQLFFVIFTSFLHSTLSLSNSLVKIWQVVETKDLFAVEMQVFWAFTHFSLIVFLVLPSHDLTAAANETAQIVCKLVNRDLSSELKEQMDSFLLQLLHHNTTITAMGFFPVRKHILVSIAGAVTTYLVVMVQYRIRET